MNYIKTTLIVAFVLLVGGYQLVTSPVAIYSRSSLSVVKVVDIRYDPEEGRFVPFGHASGAFIDFKGTILTAAHVVRNKPILAVYYMGRTLTYRVLAVDLKHDLALMVPHKRQVLSLPLPIYGVIVPGDRVYTLGYPGQMPRMFTSGFVSYTSDDLTITSAPIGFGSSGGPILSPLGCIISVVSGFRTPGNDIGAWQGFTDGASSRSIRLFVEAHNK